MVLRYLRWLLFPFSIPYGIAMAIRSRMYKMGVLKSYQIPVKSIVVGNLSVGGTGKTPFVDFLIQHFLEEKIKLSTLSRGYGRKTSGVIHAQKGSTAAQIGDEPLLYFSRYEPAIEVFVAEKRKLGVEAILQNDPKTDLIILDDAFQHRAVTAGLNVLITEFGNLYSGGFILPAGNLREWPSAAKRADVIVVSKCPENLTEEIKDLVRQQLRIRPHQKLFFSSIQYLPLHSCSNEEVNPVQNILLVTGIGNPEPLRRELSKTYSVTQIKFPDHHDFTAANIAEIHQKFDTFAPHEKMIVTTEKDFMRLKQFDAVTNGTYPWFYQPIALKFDNEEQLKHLLNEYVREN